MAGPVAGAAAAVQKAVGSTAKRNSGVEPSQLSMTEEEDAFAEASLAMTSANILHVAQDLNMEQRGEQELLEAAQRAGWSKGEMAEAVKKIASLENEAHHRYSREQFSDAATLPAVVLINNGRFDELKASDVQALFDCLDKDNSGMLDFEEIKLLLTEVLQPACTDDQVNLIYQLTDKRPDGQVSSEELYYALTEGAVKQHLRQLQKENAALKDLEQFLGIGLKVDRNFVLERLRWAVNRDDSFKTLPFSIAFICIFIGLVILHLAIFERQMVEDGLADWVEGYAGGPVGPYFDTVSDNEGMFGWLTTSGLAAVLGNCHVDGAMSSCIVGSRGVLIGDARLYQTLRDGSEQSVWLLSAEPARALLADRPGAYFDAAMATIGHLQANSWADDKTQEMHLAFNTFGRDSQMFAVTDVQVHMDDFGYVSPIVSVSAVVVDPYPLPTMRQVFFYILDALFLLCLLYPLISELKDLIQTICLTGFYDACKTYWGIWNLVDWASISAGFTVVAFWILSCQAMHDDSIYSLLEKSESGELTLAPGVMNLDEGLLNALDDAFAQIVSLFFIIRILVACNSVFIVFKFFKASQANPRLRIVTETLAKASGDIFHWGVVFVAVFLGFAVTGHILFGIDLVQFRSFGSSIDSCFRTLMGEFEWYVDMSSSLKPTLDSGVPLILVNLWFYIFMLFVLLILVNMLLAIVLEHYIELLSKLSHDTDAPTVWDQAFRFWRDRRAQKGFISQKLLLRVLEDDDQLEDDALTIDVSEDNFMKTFPKMKGDQASSLMGWLENQALIKSKEEHSEFDERLRMLEGHIDTITQHLHTVKLNVALCTSKLKHVSKGSPRSSSKEVKGKKGSGSKPKDGEDGYYSSECSHSRSKSPPMSLGPSRENSQTHERGNRHDNRNMTVASVLNADGRRIYTAEDSGSKRSTDSKTRQGPSTAPPGSEVPMKEQVDNMTLKLGSAVQDLQWQLTGALERLGNQADKFMVLAGHHQAPAVTSQLDSFSNSRSTSPSPAVASRNRSRQAEQPNAVANKQMPPCWSTASTERNVVKLPDAPS